MRPRHPRSVFLPGEAEAAQAIRLRMAERRMRDGARDDAVGVLAMECLTFAVLLVAGLIAWEWLR